MLYYIINYYIIDIIMLRTTSPRTTQIHQNNKTTKTTHEAINNETQQTQNSNRKGLPRREPGQERAPPRGGPPDGLGSHRPLPRPQKTYSITSYSI